MVFDAFVCLSMCANVQSHSMLVAGDPTETDQRFKFVGLCGLYVLYVKVFQTVDKKMFRQFWDSYRKVCSCRLCSRQSNMFCL